MESLPDALCAALVCPLVPLRDRVHALSRVSRRWRQLAWRSIHCDRALDLTWCSGEHELHGVVAALAANSVGGSVSTKLEAFRLYGPRVDASVLRILTSYVGGVRIKSINIESKQTDDGALALLSQCTELEELVLHCVKLTSRALAPIARACSHLQSVDLAGCSRVCDAGIVDLATYCPRLRALDLSMCHRVSDRSIAVLGFRKHKTLERVVVDRCLKISGLAMRFLMKSQPRLHGLSFAHCPRVQDLEFVALSKQLAVSTARLEAIEMSGCVMLGDQGVASLVSRNAETLCRLGARALVTLTSVAFQSIARCRQLTELNLSMNRTLQNADLECIVASCPLLQIFQLQGCNQIDDDGAEAIACYGKQLTTLSLEFCYNITDGGITEIIRRCRRLQDLNLKALNQLTIETFDGLIRLKSPDAPLRRINIGAIGDFETTLQYASIIKRRFPRARIDWT